MRDDLMKACSQETSETLDDTDGSDDTDDSDAELFSDGQRAKPAPATARIRLSGDEVVAEVLNHFQGQEPTAGQLNAFVEKRFGVWGLTKQYKASLYARCFGKCFRQPSTPEGALCRSLILAALQQQAAAPMSRQQLLDEMQRMAQQSGQPMPCQGTGSSLFKGALISLAREGKIRKSVGAAGDAYALPPPGCVPPQSRSSLVRANALVHEWKQKHPGRRPTLRSIQSMAGAAGVPKSAIHGAIHVYYDYPARPATNRPTAALSGNDVAGAGGDLPKAMEFIAQFPPGYVVSLGMLRRNLGQRLLDIMEELKKRGCVRKIHDRPAVWITTAGPASWSAKRRLEYIPAPPHSKKALLTTVRELVQSIQKWMSETGLARLDPATVQELKVRYWLGKLRTCLLILHRHGITPSEPTGSLLARLGLDWQTLEPLTTLPNFEAKLSPAIQDQDPAPQRSGAAGMVRPWVSRNMRKMMDYIDQMPLDLRPWFLPLAQQSPVRIRLVNEQVHAPIPAGEQRQERVQSYFSQMCKTGAGARLDKQEVQCGFGRSPGSADDQPFDHVVLSANRSDGAAALLEVLGLDPAQATMQQLPQGLRCLTWTDVDLYGLVVQTVAKALAKVPGKHREVLERHALKLLERLPQMVDARVSLHIPMNPDRHAEMCVLDVFGYLDLFSPCPPTGTKEPCIACAIGIESSGHIVPNATVVYASNLPEYGELRGRLEDPTVVHGTKFAPGQTTAGAVLRSIGPRRSSSSPPPQNVSLPRYRDSQASTMLSESDDE